MHPSQHCMEQHYSGQPAEPLQAEGLKQRYLEPINIVRPPVQGTGVCDAPDKRPWACLAATCAKVGTPFVCCIVCAQLYEGLICILRGYPVTTRRQKRCSAARLCVRAAASAEATREQHASFSCATLNILAPIYKRTARCNLGICLLALPSTCKCTCSVTPWLSPTCSSQDAFHLHTVQVNTAVGATRGRESSDPEAYMPRNRALVDLLLERRQDIYCLQVRQAA